MKHVSKSLEETEQAARIFLESVTQTKTAMVTALEGDLGAGKTTFTQAVGRLLGVEENMHSPTFVIEKIYPIDFRGFKNLIHIDAYRLEKEAELMHLGWEELIREPENLIMIEWPSNVSGIIPKSAKKVFFKFTDESTREIEIHES